MVVTKEVMMRLIIVMMMVAIVMVMMMVAMVMVMVKTTPSCVGSVAACVLVPPPTDQHSMLLPTHSAMPEKGSCLPLHHKMWYNGTMYQWYIPGYRRGYSVVPGVQRGFERNPMKSYIRVQICHWVFYCFYTSCWWKMEETPHHFHRCDPQQPPRWELDVVFLQHLDFLL